MHFMIQIKGQKQESLKGQNQHYKKNITYDVYQRWYDRTNKKIHFITPIKDQKQESLKGQSQHYKNNVTDDVYNQTTQNLNKILGNNGNRMLQNLIGT